MYPAGQRPRTTAACDNDVETCCLNVANTSASPGYRARFPWTCGAISSPCTASLPVSAFLCTVVTVVSLTPQLLLVTGCASRGFLGRPLRLGQLCLVGVVVRCTVVTVFSLAGRVYQRLLGFRLHPRCPGLL